MNPVNNENVLEVQGIAMSFGGLMALSILNFQVKRGIIKGIIGPNGAGKTTLFYIITGSFPPTNGTIRF
jgi:branched-chain amino acid transport system ATP-binding protein